MSKLNGVPSMTRKDHSHLRDGRVVQKSGVGVRDALGVKMAFTIVWLHNTTQLKITVCNIIMFAIR